MNNKIIELKKLLNGKEKTIIQNDKFERINFDNNNNSKLMELYELLALKDKEIKDLRELKERYPFNLLKGEKMMSIIFYSLDQKLHTSVLCKNTDKFNKIENLLYDEYPDYKENTNSFIINGKTINKYDSLEKNGIKNNDIIILNKLNI